jgi:hypothetical protein
VWSTRPPAGWEAERSGRICRVVTTTTWLLARLPGASVRLSAFSMFIQEYGGNMANVRQVQVRAGDRQVSPDAATQMSVPSASAPSARAAWLRAYDTVRATCSAPNAPGVGVFAVDARGVAAAVVMAARRDGIQTAIVGRHPETHIPLTGDDTLSGRHLAVILHPIGDERLSFRLIDLRTTGGMRDERCRRVEHLVSDGPAFVQVGRYCVLVVPLCDPRLGWPDDPLEGWRQLPDRVFQTVEGGKRRSERVTSAFEQPVDDRERVDDGPADPNATLVQTIPGLRFAGAIHRVRPVEGAGSTEPLVGELVIASRSGATASVPVDAATARSGLILGRDERCDNAGWSLDDPRISRVHLVVIEIGGVMYAVDTASTNGVWRDGADAGGVAIPYDERLTIARGLAWLKWMPPPP